MAANPPSFTPSSWTNQRLTLYHGTVDRYVPSILSSINVRQGRAHTDFGQGFYTTTVERQALSWAWQLSQRLPGTQPAVIRFAVNRDDLAALECLWFVRGNFDADDFWSLVFHCRTGGGDQNRATNHGWYDVVIGLVAASWRQRLTIYDADQVSFHTDRAANLLNTSKPEENLMIDSKAKDAFWDVVEDCLVEIHGFSKPAAQQRSVDLRTRIESPPTGMSSEIFYHAEPFDVACDLAGRQLDLSHFRFQYDSILDRHNW